MATFTFDGTESVTTPFNVATDRVIFNLNAADFAVITEDRSANTVSFVTTSGAVLTLTNTNFAAISAAQPNSLVPGIDSDIDFAIGTRGPNAALTGNVVVGLEGNDGITGTPATTVEGVEIGRPGGLLLGNQGSDVISNGGLFSVRMFGGQGNDRLTLATTEGSDESLLVGGLGSDIIAVNGGTETIEGTPEVVDPDTGDVITPAVPATTVTGGYTGNVTIFGGNGEADAVDGRDVIDVALGAGGTAVVYANGGDDEVNITLDQTVVDGEVVSGSAGMATVFGGQGNDAITAAVDGGLFVGGLGTDTINITSVGTEGNAFTVFGGNGEADAADGRDLITLDLQDNDTALVYGNGGNDVISINAGDGAGANAQVTVFGGQGNDVITGVVGNDSLLVGGLGNDRIDVSLENIGADATAGTPELGSSVTVFGGNGVADAADGADIIEVALLGDIRGETPSLAQTAQIFGNGGNDQIVLTGQGAASVHGGQGDDILTVQGTGLYTLTGGQGADRFDFSSDLAGTVAGVNGGTLATATVAADVSRITDLNFDEDELALGNNVQVVANISSTATTGANLSVAANTAFAQVTSTTAAGVDAAVIFSYQGQQYLVSGTVDGTTTPVEGGDPLVTDTLTALINITGFTGTIGTDDFVGVA